MRTSWTKRRGLTVRRSNALRRWRRSAAPRWPFMEPLFKEWSEFLQLLTRHRVRFMLVGGHAVGVHAVPRHTEDLDVFVDPTPANARRLRAALIDFGFGSVVPEVEILATP